MDSATLTGELKERARLEGFDAVAIARAGRLDRDAAALSAWLRRDRHATMAWMARNPDVRAEPGRVLPGCRSVVSVAQNYWPGDRRAAGSPRRGKTAIYARGRDYHRVVGRGLKALAAWLEETSGQRSRSFVDTGPVLERAWAERAGIGWIGKNANLVSRRFGSWLLLGEILTVAELQPDSGPHPDYCGTCAACMEACPTSAIVEPGVVDSGRCISYWTIEHRGPIPEPRREEIGGWIFGCDDCQTVCPWNQAFASPAAADPLEFREDLAGIDPAELLEMDEAAFRTRFSGTPIMRARWDGMRRNACIVLGNRRDPRFVGALAGALSADDPMIRAHAAWALGRIGGERARSALDSAVAGEHDPEVREAIVAGIRACGAPEAGTGAADA